MARFHYAFKVKDIPSTRKFYIDLLGCTEGRSTDTWIDFDFFGNQLSAHVNNKIAPLDYCGKVDGVEVPMPHFGALLSREQFSEIRTKLEKANINFIIPPQLRYEGKVGEQWTMFAIDPSDNPIEFKSFTNDNEIFSV
ncbi:MAG TPA: glyoxalase [Saprospiraceae bacterium]|nr:glyoxalase [Saprospiraceae bacterium]